MSAWFIDMFIIVKLHSLSLVILFTVEYALSNINIALRFWLVFSMMYNFPSYHF